MRAPGELHYRAQSHLASSALLPACGYVHPSCLSVCLSVCLCPQGQPKVQESLWQALCSIWRMSTTRLGLVRLNISQPFSLRVSGHRQ